MKRILLTLALIVFVRGHWRGETWVSPHFRSSPNDSTEDNWGPSERPVKLVMEFI